MREVLHEKHIGRTKECSLIVCHAGTAGEEIDIHYLPAVLYRLMGLLSKHPVPDFLSRGMIISFPFALAAIIIFAVSFFI